MATTATFLTEFRSSMTFEYKTAMDNNQDGVGMTPQQFSLVDHKSPEVTFDMRRSSDLQHSPGSSRGTSLASSPALPMESSGISNGLSHDFSVRDPNMEDPLSDDSISMPNDLSGYNGDQDEMPSPLAQLQCALEKTGMLGKKLNLPAYPGADGTRALDRNCFPTSQTEDHQGVPYEELMYKCHLCSYTGNSKSHFDSHMNSHFDHRCPFCDYTSRTEGRLKRHVKDFHSETPPDSWAGTRVPRNDGSGGELSMDDSVSSTGNNNMNKPRTYRCKQCGFVAYKKNEFWEHNKTHIKAEKLLTCPQCAFVTEYKHHLEYHIRNHFGSKPFKCGKCNYSCVNKSMLNSHMKSHSNIYQYRCANCSYATKYCHSLKLHLRKYDHKPASVLNVDGTPNPYPVIDVYGTRRGPRPKKRKYADDSDTPGIINTPVISSQASMNYPAVMPSNLPMLYPPQFFNGYHGNVFIRPPTNGEAFRDVTSHRNPRFGFSPNPQPLKCLLCEFTPDNQEMLHKHMLLHAAKENQDLIKLYGINSETILQMQEQQMAANNYLHHQHHNRYLQENGVYKIEMERKGIKMAKIQDTSEINNVPELNYSVASIKELEEHPRRNEDLNHVQKEDIKVFERNEPFLPIGNGKEREDNESNIPSRSVIVSHKSPTPPAAPKEQEITEQKVFETQNIQSTQSIQPSIMESSPLDLSNGKTNDFQSPSSNDDVEEIFSSPTEVTMLKDSTNEPLCLPPVDNRSSPSNSSQAQPRNRRKGKAFKLDRYRQFEDHNALQFNGSNTKSRPIPENMLTPNNGMLKSFEHCTLNTKSNSHSSMDNSLMEHRNSPKKFLSMPTSQVSSPSSFNDRMLSIPSPRQANILQQDTSTVSSKTTPMAMKPLHTVPAKSTSPLSKVPELVPKVEPDFTETKEKDQKWQDAYMCTFCDMAFRDGMMYSMHVGYHMNGDPYTCNMCGHASKDKVEFFLHIARVAHS